MIPEEIICFDFDVDFVSELLGQQIYAKVKGANYHIVIIAGDSIKQASVNRFELVNELYDVVYEEQQQTAFRLLSNNVILSVKNNDDKLEISMGINGATNTLPFLFEDSPIEDIVKSDLEVLNKIKTNDALQADFKAKTIEGLISDNSQSVEGRVDLLTDIDFEAIAFEKETQDGIDEYCLSNLYFNFLEGDLRPSSSLVYSFYDSLEFLDRVASPTIEEEENGDAAVYHKLMKSRSIYFIEPGLIEKEGVDYNNIEKIVEQLWANLTVQQRVALLYIADYIEGNPIFSLSFFDEDFDLSFYHDIVCTPFQPDSNEEQQVLKADSLVNCFLRINK